jgi:hypothetical protein
MTTRRVQSIDVVASTFDAEDGWLDIQEGHAPEQGQWSASVTLDGLIPAALRGEGEYELTMHTVGGGSLTGHAFIDATLSNRGGRETSTLAIRGTGDFDVN